MQITDARRAAAAPSHDAELVQAARDGDATAFEAIMRRHNRLLFRTARGIVDDDAEAQDIVQETYLRAFVALESFRGEAALATWLARIAINLALTSQRRKGRLVALEDGSGDDDGADTMSGTELALAEATPNETPDAAAERGELRRFLQTAIDHLPPIYRSVFILRAVEELSVDETAACLRVSADVVKTRFGRSRTMLRETLGAQVEDGARHAYPFAGARCDAVCAAVLAELRRRRMLR